MRKRKPKPPSHPVAHPRFGARSVPSGYKLPRDRCPGFSNGDEPHDDTIFPDSAIPADLSRQTPMTIPRLYYVDRLRRCRFCRRPFFFFAREQKYWYESLGFYISMSHEMQCPECRRTAHELRRRFRRYSHRVVKTDLTDAKFTTLIEDAVFLFKAGRLRSAQRLRTLKNLALARCPESPATRAILDVVAEIPSAD